MALPYNIYQFTSQPPFPSTTTKPFSIALLYGEKKEIFIRFSFSLTIIVHAHALHPLRLFVQPTDFSFLPPTRSFHSIEILHSFHSAVISRWSSSSNGGGSQGIIFFLQTKPKQTRIRKNILCSSSSKGCKANIHDDDGENASSSSSSSVGDLIFKASTTTIVPSLCSGTLCLFVCVFVCLCTGIEFGNGMARERENLPCIEIFAFLFLLSFLLLFLFPTVCTAALGTTTTTNQSSDFFAVFLELLLLLL